jgi:hypothetical protein
MPAPVFGMRCSCGATATGEAKGWGYDAKGFVQCPACAKLPRCRYAAPGTFSHECGKPAIARSSGLPYCAEHAPVERSEPLAELHESHVRPALPGPLFSQREQGELF